MRERIVEGAKSYQGWHGFGFTEPVKPQSTRPDFWGRPMLHHKECVRYNEPGHAHELTFSCYRRLPLLSRGRTRRWFVDALGAARIKERFDLWAYVVMPEHAHVLLRPREPKYDISRILWRIKQPVGEQAVAFLSWHAPKWLETLTVVKRDGSRERRFWQVGGGYDRNVIEATTLVKVIDYIHLNPVRRGLVDRPEDWEWSSARWYQGGKPVPIGMDATLPPMIDPPS